MVRVEDIATAALAYDALEVRSLLQDWVRERPDWPRLALPSSTDQRVLAVAAAFVELLAERAGSLAPPWTRSIGPVDSPLHLVRAALTMTRTRLRIEAETPHAFRSRNLFAPASYATFV